MSDIFYDVASIDYPILDADAHVNEPPDLWQTRVPQRLRTHAPKVLRTEQGDVWSFDDGKRLRPLGLTATAGLSYLQFRAEGFRYEEIRSGSFDPRARLDDLDADGIWAQVLEQLDDMFLRYRWFSGAVDTMKEMPSRVFHRSFWATFM